MTDFDSVLAAWDAEAIAGAKHTHPLDPDTPAFWHLGREQAEQVNRYAEPGSFVIDFGAGIGRLALPLADMGYQVLAVDASPAMLAELERRAAEAGVRVPTLRSDGVGLARLLRRGRAAAVIARAVLIHHDYAGVERIVTGLAEAMRPGGHLIADWPIGDTGERLGWRGVTTWGRGRRLAVAARAGLEAVEDGPPSVWRKTEGDTDE